MHENSRKHHFKAALQWQNKLTYHCWGLRPQTPGGFAARMKLGAPPPDSRQLRRKCAAGGSAQYPKLLLNGVWGGVPPGFWGQSPQLRTSGEAARGLGAEPPAIVS